MTRRASTTEPWYRAFRRGAADAAPPVRAVHEAVFAQLRRSPPRHLLVDEARSLRNDALVELIEQRARVLLERCGRSDETVAVTLCNGVELAITYFACLQAGLRYLPLPAMPPDVTVRLLDAIGPRLVVTDEERTASSVAATLVLGDSGDMSTIGPLPPPEPARPAHVLLTSGTETGLPRAVVTDHVGSMLSHRWRISLWPYDTARDVVGCNIFGIWDVVPALLQGVPVVMLKDTTLRDPLALADAVVRFGITRMMLTPTLLDACLESAEAVLALGRLRLIVLCGETVTPALMQRVWQRLPDVQVANLYSLSECHDVAAGILEPGGPISAGRVAPFADVHVVQPEDTRRLMPVGEPGRLLVSGAGLARGYLDAEATAQQFFTVSFDGRSVDVYDTGDLGRLNADGTLDILGRIGGPLKIRGAWADPDAVTAVLLEQPGVARAVAVAESSDDDYPRLSAFVVPAQGAPDDVIERLRTALARVLPPQSMPGRIELRDAIPLLPSGKIDPLRLRRSDTPTSGPPAAGRPAAAASLEQPVLTAFRDVLGLPSAGPDDAFDDLGGDSLAAILLCSRLHDLTGRRVRVRDLQRHPRPAELARFLTERAITRTLRRFPMPRARFPASSRLPATAPHTVLVTGATGTLGRALLERMLQRSPMHVVALVRAAGVADARARLTALLPDGTPLTRLTVLAGDLTRPRLGLTETVFADLGRRLDRVLHLAARLDMFAGYRSLAAANVTGTRRLLELALTSGATFHHLSSSAVLPLGATESWDESHLGRPLLEALAPRLTLSDGYSQTKLAAESLVWQAAERGLPVRVIRLPHLTGAGQRSRLTDTLSSLALLGGLPEGPWQWQVADVDAVRERILHPLESEWEREPPVSERSPDREPLLLHLAPPPISDRAIDEALRRRGLELPRLTLPALANVITEAARRGSPEWTAGQRANVIALAQLVREYGVRAALCLDEPVLASDRPLDTQPARLLVDSLPR